VGEKVLIFISCKRLLYDQVQVLCGGKGFFVIQIRREVSACKKNVGHVHDTKKGICDE
jgi:hypothetical protein